MGEWNRERVESAAGCTAAALLRYWSVDASIVVFLFVLFGSPLFGYAHTHSHSL